MIGIAYCRLSAAVHTSLPEWACRRPQFQPDGRIITGGLDSNIKHDAPVQHSLEESFVRSR
jgi:hypothetical protein